MFPIPIYFLKIELKTELRMKSKKEREDYADDHEDKGSKTYMVKVKKYDYGTPEEFLKWCLTLNETVKNTGYGESYYNVMNLAQAMLAGRSLEAFLNEKRSQEAKKRIGKTKTHTEHTPKQIYDFAIFELAVRASVPTVHTGFPATPFISSP
jgi:hypothetical protein